MLSRSFALALLPLLGAACSSSSNPTTPTADGGATNGGDGGTGPATNETDAQFGADTVSGMHDSILSDLNALLESAKTLQAAAPTPSGRGWDPTQDATAIASMKDAWKACRTAYEHIEGAVAPIFPDIDTSIDARYDDFLTQLGGAGDADPFDDKGVTGMHAMERILYSPSIPQVTLNFEKTLPGYAPAAFPGTEQAAAEFKTKLAQKLIDDVSFLVAQWTPANIDIGVAFSGLVSLMNEQHEKVKKAATGEEESRYAQLTLFDLRNNLDGTAKIYKLFQRWILARPSTDPTKDGPAADTAIQAGFQKLAAAYAADPGDALPPTPATWSSLNPTPADLATPFGVLFATVGAAVDPQAPGSVVYEMNLVSAVLFPHPVGK